MSFLLHSGFSPSDISGYYNHFDATTISASDGNRVSSWSDKNGIMNVSNGTGTSVNMPTYTANFQNGHPVLYFNRTEENWLTGSLGTHQSQANTFVAAFRHDGPSGSTDYICDGPSDGGGRHIMFSEGGTPVSAWAGNTMSSSHASGSFDIHTVVYDNGNGIIRVNGNEVQSDTTVGTNQYGGLTLGSRYNAPSQAGENYIGEFIVYNTRLSANEMTDVENYLMDKWGVSPDSGPTYGSTTNLGADDPGYTSTGQTTPSGVRTNPNTAIEGYRVTISSETDGVSRLMIYNEPNDTILASKSVSSSTGSQDTYDITHSMSSGTDYDVLVDNNGSQYARGERESSWGGYPVTSSDFDVTDGKYTFTGESASTRYSIHELTSITSL